MKITFEFETTNENFFECSDNIRLYNIQTAEDMAMCLNALREKIRSLLKWDERELIPKDEIDEKFWEIIKEYNINFEKMGY